MRKVQAVYVTFDDDDADTTQMPLNDFHGDIFSTRESACINIFGAMFSISYFMTPNSSHCPNPAPELMPDQTMKDDYMSPILTPESESLAANSLPTLTHPVLRFWGLAKISKYLPPGTIASAIVYNSNGF